MAEEYDYLFKSIVLGDGGVGKTALTLRFSKSFFNEDYTTTIGVDFHVKTISIETAEGIIKCKFQLWDTGGQERFSYYRGSLGAVLVFDLTNYLSFEHLPQWIEEVRANIKAEIPLLLVGNKSDLIDLRSVSINEINNFTRDFNLYYMETSAKTGDGVGDCFYILACLMIGSGVPEKLITNKTVFSPGNITLKEKTPISKTFVVEPKMDYAAPPIIGGSTTSFIDWTKAETHPQKILKVREGVLLDLRAKVNQLEHDLSYNKEELRKTKEELKETQKKLNGREKNLLKSSEIENEHLRNPIYENNLLIKLLEEKDKEIEQLKLEYELLDQESKLVEPSLKIDLEENLGNKEQILNLLKLKHLTSNEIAKKLNLSKQDTRTYLQRLKAEDKIKVIDKKGRLLIYALKKPLVSAKKFAPESLEYDLSYLLNLMEMKMTPKNGVNLSPIDIMKIKKIKKRILDTKWENKNEMKALREFIDFEKTYKEEIDDKLSELEAKINYITSGLESQPEVMTQEEKPRDDHLREIEKEKLQTVSIQEKSASDVIFQGKTESIYKVVVIGDPATGKTELLSKFAKPFEEKCLPTVGVNIVKESITLDDLDGTVNLMLWDVAGQPQFYMLHRPYFNGADGIIFTFDLTRSSTFSNINNWHSTVVKHGLSGVPKILVGILKDINSEEERKIILPMAEHLSEKLNAPYFEVRLDTGKNVKRIFQTMAKMIYDREMGEHSDKIKEVKKTKISSVKEAESEISLPRQSEIKFKTPEEFLSELPPEIEYTVPPVPEAPSVSVERSLITNLANYVPKKILSKKEKKTLKKKKREEEKDKLDNNITSKKDVVKCQYCGYIIVRPYPKDQICPNCAKFLTGLFQYKNEKNTGAWMEPKEFTIMTPTPISKFQGKIKVKAKRDPYSIEDEKINLNNENEYFKFIGITSVERTKLFANNEKYKYLLELSNNLDFIATSILGGELDKMLITDGDINEKCQFYVKDNIIYLVYGIFPDKKGKWILEQMAKYYSELVQNKDVDHLEKFEKNQIDFNFKRRLNYILKEYLTLQDVFTDQELPYLEDWIRIDYLGLSSMSIGVISLLLDEEDNLNVEVPGQYDNPSEEIEMKESLLTAKIEAIAANTLGNTGFYPRWIAVKLGFQHYRFLTFKRYQNDYFLSLLSEGNLQKIEMVEKKIEPYLYHGIDTPFVGNLRPFNKIKSTLKDLIRMNSAEVTQLKTQEEAEILRENQKQQDTDAIFDLIKKAERLAQEYEIKKKEGILNIASPYPEIINLYKEAKMCFEKIGWNEQADQLINSINHYKKKLEADKKVREYEAQKLEKEKKLEEKRKLEVKIAREAEAELLKQKAQALKLKKQQSLEYEVKKEQAFNFMDLAKRELKQNHFDKAIKFYKNSEQIFTEINWPEGIRMINDSINLIKKEMEALEREREK